MPLSQKVVFSRMEVTAIQRLDWDQYWDFHPQDSHPIGVEDFVLGLKDDENSHTLTTTTTGSNTHKKPTIRETIRINALCLPKVPSLPLVLDAVKCKTHTQQQNELIKISRDVVNQQVQLKSG